MSPQAADCSRISASDRLNSVNRNRIQPGDRIVSFCLPGRSWKIGFTDRQGPVENFQFRTSGLLGLDLSYTHYLTDRLSIVGTMSRIIGQVIVTERTAIEFQERSVSDLYGPLFRLSVSYSLGR